MRRAVSATVVLVTLWLAFPAAGGWGKPRHSIVRGQVADERGRGIEGIPVRVIATRRVVKFLTIESRPAEKELVATVTGPNGFYELDVPKIRDYDFYFLRFYDSKLFDSIRYAMPPDVEITRRINKRRPVIQDVELPAAAGWDAVIRLVDLYGAHSTRGKIIRQLGVPDRTERAGAAEGVARETWWYDSVGVAYVIEGGEVVDKKSFQPVKESLPLARR